MLLTPKLVFIHMPKTGGTFVNRALVRVFRRPEPRTRIGRWWARRGEPPVRHHAVHGTCSEIPASHAGLPILSIIRNPYDRYVSQYEFRWWRDHPEDFPWVDWAEVRRRFPSFPEITLPEFIRFSGLFLKRLESGLPREREAVGFHTEQFLRFYSRRPAEAYRAVASGGGREAAELHAVRFVHMEDLNGELGRALVEMGIDGKALDFLDTTEKVYPKQGVRRESPRCSAPGCLGHDVGC